MRNQIKKVIAVVLSVVIAFGTAFVVTPNAVKAAENYESLVFGRTYSEKYGEAQTYNMTLTTSGKLTIAVKTAASSEIKIKDSYGNTIFLEYYFSDSYTADIDLLAGQYQLFVEAFGTLVEYTPIFNASGETKIENYSYKNNEQSTATNLSSVNNMINGQLAANDDRDIYKIKVPKGGNLNLNFLSNVRETSFQLTDAFGDYTYSSETISGGTHRYSMAVPAGTYYLTIYNEDSDYGGTYTIITKLKNFKKTSLKAVKNVKPRKLKVKWKRVSNVSGYQVQIARNKKFTKKKIEYSSQSNSESKVTFINLKKKKTYYVRIRTYTLTENDKKCYSSWSKVKKIKIKK